MSLEIGMELVYIVAALLFVLGIKMLGSPATARKGNMVSALGMLIAVVATLLLLEGMKETQKDIQEIQYQWILWPIVVGTIIGILAAKFVQMTSMPEMVALLNGFGGVASLLVGWGVYQYAFVVEGAPEMDTVKSASVFLSVLIGGVTLTGSLIAWAKLKEVMTGKPIHFPGQVFLNFLLVAGSIGAGVYFSMNPMAPDSSTLFLVVIGVSFLLGILAVIPIGGADMPVVISLMNSYSGLAACSAGFIIKNNVLIVSGALVGASGIILTIIMCKAMNRSLTNVLIGGLGAGGGGGKEVTGEMKPLSPQDAYYILEAANSVVFVPGYGLAVAQAQHVVRELGELLEENGCEVQYAIHPVAGRMPGHMNVLLAEANVSYDKLVEMDDINPNIENMDVAVVIGANDVVNPAAREDDTSPIYGMPIINVDKARTVFVLKRGAGTGFAGIQNPLFFGENTRMIYGNAKDTVQALVDEFKG